MTYAIANTTMDERAFEKCKLAGLEIQPHSLHGVVMVVDDGKIKESA